MNDKIDKYIKEGRKNIVVGYNIFNTHGQSMSIGGGSCSIEGFVECRDESVDSTYDAISIQHRNDSSQLHREDGPAVENKDSRDIWFINGKEIKDKDIIKLKKRRSVIKKVLNSSGS